MTQGIIRPKDVPPLSIGTVIGGWSEAKRAWDEAFHAIDGRLTPAMAGLTVMPRADSGSRNTSVSPVATVRVSPSPNVSTRKPE